MSFRVLYDDTTIHRILVPGRKSAITINDTIRKLVQKLDLRGHVKYLDRSDYNFVPLDCLVEDADGKPVDVSQLISVTLEMTVKLLGVVDCHTE